MIELLTQFRENLTWNHIGFFALAIILSVIISYAAIILVMVNIPADYFSSSYNFKHQNDKHFLVQWGAAIFKNLVGVLLIIAGVVMIFGSRSRRFDDSF